MSLPLVDVNIALFSFYFEYFYVQKIMKIMQFLTSINGDDILLLFVIYKIIFPYS